MHFVLTLLMTAASSWAHQHPASSYHLAFTHVHAQADFTLGPAVNAESRLHIQFRDPATDQPVDPNVAKIDVVPFMPMHHHGAPPVTVTALANGVPGEYEASEIYLMMGGEWQITVTLTYADGQTESQSFAFSAGQHSH